MEIGLMILAGGKSSRMGEDKAFLTLGERTFLERLIEKGEAYGFTDILAVGVKEFAVRDTLAAAAADIYRGRGPLGGLHAGLAQGRSPAYFVVSCDMPLLDFAVVDALRAALRGGALAAVPVHAGGAEPLAAIYRAECAPVIEKMLCGEDERRVMRLYDRIDARMVGCEKFSAGFFNVNTPESYMAARAKYKNSVRKTPVVSIAAAQSGAGKTTFLEKLIPALKKRGLRIGVLKSDGHGFTLDHPGKDTWKFSRAGADAVAIAAPDQYAVMQRTQAKADLERIAEKIEDVDLILIESRAHGLFPILEIARAGVSESLITKADQLAAVITDMEGADFGKPLLPLRDPEKAAAFILTLL